MAVIRIKKNYIPIPFVDEVVNEEGELEEKIKFELRFSMTDESIERLYKQAEEIDELVQEVDEVSGQDNKDGAEKVVRKAIDAILGKGSYEKLYEESQSLVITVEYYAEIIYLLIDELKKSKMKDLEKDLTEEYFNE